MKTLYGLIKELFGLFVDDGSLAVALLVVVAVAGGIAFRFENSSAAVGVILFAGSLGVLIENVLRTARKSGR